MLWVRRHISSKGVILALADRELMDKSFEEGELVLRINSFFKGVLEMPEEALADRRGVVAINAVGHRAVAAVVGRGLCGENAPKKVAGVPHVQIFMVEA
ncbi:MAG TPA: DUF424 domain-containing protein [archaeon]|nr:DUF424 domain-containing protein [archaeon]